MVFREIRIGHTIIIYSKYKKLYPYSTLSYANFLNIMNKIYEYIDPAPFGETSRQSWANDIIRYASDNGITLNSNPCPVSYPKGNCENYIKSGLKLDRPVGSVNLAAKIGSGQIEAWHWVTITKYFQSSNDNRWVAVSSMGERRGLDWDAYYANMASSIMIGGFAYFN